MTTGESLGQVASQTMASMNAINEVTTLPILRPLVAMDKEEIIDVSKKSIRMRFQFSLMRIVVQYLFQNIPLLIHVVIKLLLFNKAMIYRKKLLKQLKSQK